MNFFKKHSGDIVFVALSILLCLNIDWSFSNIKSFITGGVISVGLIQRFFRE